MDCKEFNKCVPLFIEQTLEYRKLNAFLEHYRTCADCREELEITFLMAYVLENEDHITFNLADELNRHIEKGLYCRKCFRRRIMLQFAAFFITNITALIAAILFLITFVL